MTPRRTKPHTRAVQSRAAKLGLLAVLVAMSIAAGGTVSGEGPRLVLRVAPSRQEVGSGHEPVRVSNLHLINVEVSLSGASLPLEKLNTTANDRASQTLEVSVREVPSRRSVPSKVWQRGGSGNQSSEGATLSLQIPPEPGVVKDKLEKAFDKAERDEEARIAKGESTPGLLRRFHAERERLGSLLQNEYYRENRTGRFEIRAFYRSTAPGFWNGTIKSEPVLIEVVYDGDFLEQIGFR